MAARAAFSPTALELENPTKGAVKCDGVGCFDWCRGMEEKESWAVVFLPFFP